MSHPSFQNVSYFLPLSTSTCFPIELPCCLRLITYPKNFSWQRLVVISSFVVSSASLKTSSLVFVAVHGIVNIRLRKQIYVFVLVDWWSKAARLLPCNTEESFFELWMLVWNWWKLISFSGTLTWPGQFSIWCNHSSQIFELIYLL